MELARLEFYGGLYYSDNPGVILPSKVVEATINGGARKFKEGMLAKSGLAVMKHSKLIFEGPQTVDEMWKDGRFTFQEMVVVQRSRILRTRPKFDKWSVEIEVSYEDTVCDKEQVHKWLVKAGQVVGMCDYRPRYGRFEVELI
jgi:hypothetical protein